MMTPQLTEQYGQVLRVSLVREILSVRDCATTGATSSPNADSAAPPAIDRWRKARLEIAGIAIRASGEVCHTVAESVSGSGKYTRPGGRCARRRRGGGGRGTV